MEIKKPAISGTLESSDVMVTVEPGSGSIELNLESTVIKQYKRQIEAVIYETLEKLGVSSVQISVNDKGALDCTIRARIENAVYRSSGITEDIPWGRWTK